MKHWLLTNRIALIAFVIILVATGTAVARFRSSGHLTVLEAQSMDMSAMRPPTGAALVELATARRGSISDTVTYTGTIQAYNEQDISPRVTGVVVSLPVYPGDTVRAGQLVAQLDTAEVAATTAQEQANANSAQIAATVAHLTHHEHHAYALDEAAAQEQSAKAAVADAQAQEQAAQDAIGESRANVQSAKANSDYWALEIAREKKLADAGAVSRQEYQDELAQSQAATAAVASASAKLRQALAMTTAARAKVSQANSQFSAATADRRMAEVDMTISQAQTQQAEAGAVAARAAEKHAAVIESYTRITSPSSGVITDRPIAPGTLVQPGTTMLKIAEIDRVRVQANVAVSDLTGIQVGTPVQIEIQGVVGPAIRARVTSVFPSASDQMHTAIVEAVIPNPEHTLLPGGFATMKIECATHTDKLLVPAGSVISQSGQDYLWIAQGAGQMYEAVICHAKYTAAQAKKYHYICPMDHGKMVPISTPLNQAITAHEIVVETGASDGDWTEIEPGAVSEGDRVIDKGQAGLTEGATVVSVAWGPNGPVALPRAAQADSGRIVYRCDKCGMTFSAADAKKDNYIDPMDGGHLIPVKPNNAMPGMKM